MKILILLTIFSSQIFSHMLFINDLNYPSGGNTEKSSNMSPTEIIAESNTEDAGSELTFRFSNTGSKITSLEQTSSAIPGGYYLGQKVPNPFDQVTSIYFSLPFQQHVRVVILDMLGQSVKVLINDVVNAGTYKLNIDASGLSAGVYVYRFETENLTDSRKLLLMK